MTLRSLFIAAMASVLLASPAAAADLDTLGAWMIGSFSSAAQAEADSNFHDIRLEMVRVWPEREDGIWIYVEQAVAWAHTKPYRQRIYHVHETADGRFASTVYTLPFPDLVIGAHHDERPLAELAPEDLTVRDGCTVYLEWKAAGAFVGSTHERDCTSTLRGATWASSEITIKADRIVSWDRGWNEADQQMWGAETAGYVFLRR